MCQEGYSGWIFKVGDLALTYRNHKALLPRARRKLLLCVRTQTTQSKNHCAEAHSCQPHQPSAHGHLHAWELQVDPGHPAGLRSSRCRSGGEHGLLAMHKLCSPSPAWLSSSLASLACSCRALRASGAEATSWPSSRPTRHWDPVHEQIIFYLQIGIYLFICFSTWPCYLGGLPPLTVEPAFVSCQRLLFASTYLQPRQLFLFL